MAKKIILLFSLFLIASSAFADSYRVLYVNTKHIRVGNRYVTIGDIFKDTDTIVWSSDQQAMKVLNLKNKRIVICAAKSLKNKKSHSLYDYLTSTKRISTRSFTNNAFDEEWHLDSRLFVLDTLYITRPNYDATLVQANVVIKSHMSSREIPITFDSKYYKIPRQIINQLENMPVKLDIMEYDEKRDWKYLVYKDLSVELLPDLVKY